MVYVKPEDFRGPSLAEYCADLVLTEEEAEVTRLTSAIARQSQRFDDMVYDRFESASATYDLDGKGSVQLYLPARATAITTVKTRDLAGALTAQASTVWRLQSSLNATGDKRLSTDAVDYLQVIPGQFLGGVADSRRWPAGPQTVQVVGMFGWLVVPAEVKRAVALLVWDQFKPQADPLRKVERYVVGDATFTAPTDSKTGIGEVDDIVHEYTRPAPPTVA